MSDKRKLSQRQSDEQPKGEPIVNVDHIAITAEQLEEFDRIIPGMAAYIRGWAAKRKDAELEARTDTLTGLPNRLGLEEEMGTIMKGMVNPNKRDPEKSKACSMVFIDTNDFGLINKAMGDSAGDLAIQAVGDYFHDTLRSDDYVARKGGDEFVIAMHCPKEDAEKRLNELKQNFTEVATANFRKKLTTLIASQYEDASPEQLEELVDERLQAFQKKLAVKHDNADLEQQPFSLSFSFGVREISAEEVKTLNLRDRASVSQAMSHIMNNADEMMRDDKDAYRDNMAGYRMPDATRQRLLRDLSDNSRRMN